MALLRNQPWTRHAVLLVGLVLVISLVWSGLAFAEDGGHGGGASGGLPQFNAKTFPSQLAWLALTFIFLYVMVSQLALPQVKEVLETRDDKIAYDLNRAEELKNGSTEVLAKIDAQLAEARVDAQGLLAKTSEEIDRHFARGLAEVDSRLTAQVKDAELQVLLAKQKVIAGLGAEATAVALDLTRKLSGVKIDKAQVAQAIAHVIEERA